MADMNDEFQKFLGKISLTKTQEENLRTAREAIRDKIGKHFIDKLDRARPSFRQQGSFALGTVVIPPDGEVDIDDGVYLNDLPEDPKDWPKAEEVQQWVKDAVDGHTSSPVEIKKKCVRVIYKNNYHVDLPIYGEDGSIRVATQNEHPWPMSDPKAFHDWWNNQIKKHGQQLKKTVKYLKAWAQFKGHSRFTGVVITVLAAQNFRSALDRDDSALTKTARAISEHLDEKGDALMPPDNDENLLSKHDDVEIAVFAELFKNLADRGQEALDVSEKADAADIWITELGDRFPPVKKKTLETESRTVGPVIITSSARPYKK